MTAPPTRPVSEALTEPAARDWLRQAAQDAPRNSSVVELGVYQGASLSALCEGVRAGQAHAVYGIDPWGLEGAYPGRPNMRERYVPEDQEIAQAAAPEAYLIRGFSHRVALDWHQGEVGLLFIDAVHRLPDVIADFMAWRPHLADGAVVAFDDYIGPRFQGVVDAVQWLVANELVTWECLVGTRLAVTTFHR